MFTEAFKTIQRGELVIMRGQITLHVMKLSKEKPDQMLSADEMGMYLSIVELIDKRVEELSVED